MPEGRVDRGEEERIAGEPDVGRGVGRPFIGGVGVLFEDVDGEARVDARVARLVVGEQARDAESGGQGEREEE